MSTMIMMHNIDFDNAQLSLEKGVELASLPLSNLQYYSNSESFRTETLDEIEIKISFDNPTFITGLVLWRHNLSPSCSVKWTSYSDDELTQTVFETEELPGVETKGLGEFIWSIEPIGQSIFGEHDKKVTEIWLPDREPLAVKHQILTIKDPGNTNLFIDITRLFNGLAFSPKLNFNYGAKVQKQPVVNDSVTTNDGSFHTTDSPIVRHCELNLAWLDETERPLFSSFQDKVRVHHDFYVSLYPDRSGMKRADHAFACKFKELPGITNTHFNNYSTTISLREV